MPNNFIFSDYKLIMDISPVYSINKKNKRTGIYRDKKRDKVVIKTVPFISENDETIYLRNEANTLEVLNNVDSLYKPFTKIIKFIGEKNRVAIVTEYFKSVNLESMDKENRWNFIKKVYSNLENFKNDLDKSTLKKLPVRSPIYYLFSFQINLFKLIKRNPLKTIRYLKFSYHFYKNYLSTIIGNYELGLVHRDLYPDNILYSSRNRTIKIIDWESSIVSDSLYDLSQISMIYLKDSGVEEMILFLKNYLTNNSNSKRFSGLAIFNSIQIMANHGIEHPIFKQTDAFLDQLLSKIYPEIVYKNSLYENINSLTLDLINTFYKITKRPINSLNKKIILCYHSVDNTGWRYSINISEFKKQVEFLRGKYRVSTFNDLLTSNNVGLYFSFDDGYRSVYENAFPILQKNGIKATIFVLADYGSANRNELNNELEIADYEKIRALHNNGWEIGCHTMTHPDLNKIDDEKLRIEIINSKYKLEKELGFPIEYFAYPKGIYSKKIIKLVQEGQYKAAFTTAGEVFNQKGSKYEISRVSIDSSLTLRQIEALLSPVGLYVSKIFNKILIFKESLKSIDNFFLFKNISVILGTIFTAVILVLALRGLPGNPTSNNFNSILWKENGPFELSPERGRFALLYSLIENKSFYFSNSVAALASPDVGVANGHYVSLFAPLVSFIAIPGYLIGKYYGASQVGTFMVISVFALFNFLLIRAISIKLGANKIASLLGGLVFIFATPAFAYAVNLYQHHVSTFILLLSIFILLKSEKIWSLLAIFFLCALSIPLDYPNLFFMFPIGVVALGRIISFKRIRSKIFVNVDRVKIFTLLIMLVPIMFFLWFNKSSYDNYFQLSGTVGTANFNPDTLQAKVPLEKVANNDSEGEKRSALSFFDTRALINGFYIHFISPDRGIIYFTPIILLGILGIFFANKRNTRFTLVLVSVLCINILLYSMWKDPWGGWAFGERYLIPGFAILAIYISLLLTYFRKDIWFLILFIILFIYSSSINTLGAITSSANPPQVEVLALEKLSGVQQKYTFERNLDLLLNGYSKSFIYIVFARKYITSIDYYIFLTGLINLFGFMLIARLWFYPERKDE